jgi:hypothetical protein
VGEVEERAAREIARVEAEYRRVMKTAVDFEKRIRDRWRQRCREKNARIVELEGVVARLESQLRSQTESEAVMDRKTKERKLLALMVNDLGVADLEEREMVRLVEEIGSLSDEALDGTLAERLGLGDPSDEALQEALRHVREPERLSEGFTGAPDMSHEGRPEER